MLYKSLISLYTITASIHQYNFTTANTPTRQPRPNREMRIEILLRECILVLGFSIKDPGMVYGLEMRYGAVKSN